MKTVIADERLDARCEKSLTERGFEIIKLPPSPRLQTPVASHPDMLMFMIGDRLICHSSYFMIAKDTLQRIAHRGDLEIELSDEIFSCDYPNDVLFNSALLGDRLICRKKSTSELIKARMQDENIINVNQGYAKCSIVTVGDNAIITADPSIAKAARTCGINVLELGSSSVRLDGYDCGFIGGASGDDGEHIVFCGDISLHPEGEKIKSFCRENRREPVSLSPLPLYDYGSLIFIQNG